MSDLIRIQIKWEAPIKVFQVAQGILTCDKQVQKPNGIFFEELFSCRIKVENGSYGYSSIGEKGIPSGIFNRIKDKLEIMIKSYHDGLSLSEHSFFWVEDLTYYVVTTLYADEKRIPRTRNVALVTDETEAIDIVHCNYGDIYEFSYDYALIEKLQPGLYPAVLKEMWFQWDKQKKRYCSCEKPKEFLHMVNFTIG
jgi:hypothetical protein